MIAVICGQFACAAGVKQRIISSGAHANRTSRHGIGENAEDRGDYAIEQYHRRK